MAHVNSTFGQTTHDIIGLTTEQAAVIHALLGQARADYKMSDVFDPLDDALRADPGFVERVVMQRDTSRYYDLPRHLTGYYTQPLGGSDEGWG